MVAKPVSLVPKNLTIGLAIFAIVLGMAGHGFRLAFGESLSQILPSVLTTVAIFWVGIPLGFVIGAKVLSYFPKVTPFNRVMRLRWDCYLAVWQCCG